jgi:7,8-dihydroneopterin aldolase/epimerase/oxygenase
MLWTISIQDAKFFAYHGVYAQEKKVGHWFVVNADVSFEKKEILYLEDSIDYTAVYSIIVEKMNTPTPLLETVVQDIIQAIKKSFASISTIKVSIQKKSPAFGKGIDATKVEVFWVN